MSEQTNDSPKIKITRKPPIPTKWWPQYAELVEQGGKSSLRDCIEELAAVLQKLDRRELVIRANKTAYDLELAGKNAAELEAASTIADLRRQLASQVNCTARLESNIRFLNERVEDFSRQLAAAREQAANDLEAYFKKHAMGVTAVIQSQWARGVFSGRQEAINVLRSLCRPTEEASSK